MAKTVHYVDGCAWADGSVQMADTRQTKDWKKVTCKHCKNKRFPRGMKTDAPKVRGMVWMIYEELPTGV